MANQRLVQNNTKENDPLISTSVTKGYPILHLKNFDELKYLKQRLAEAEKDKHELKQQLQVVEVNINDIRSQIHKLLFRRDINIHRSTQLDYAQELVIPNNIDLLQKIQVEQESASNDSNRSARKWQKGKKVSVRNQNSGNRL